MELKAEPTATREVRDERCGRLARAGLWSGFALFLFMLYLPVSQNLVMGCLVALVCAVLFLKFLFLGSGLSLHPKVVSWTLFYGAVGTAYVLLGMIYGAPGAWFSSLVYVVFPFVYLVFIGAATTAGIWPALLRICVLGTIAIGLGTLEYFFRAVGWFPQSLYVNPGVVHSVAFYNGYAQMSHYSLSSLIFLVPYLMAALVVYDSRRTILPSRPIVWIALLLGLTVALLGGRRALLLVIVAAPLLVWFFRAQLPPRCRPTGGASPGRVLAGVGLLTMAIVAYLGHTLGLSWEGLHDLVLQGFDFTAGPGGGLDRAEQFVYLLHGWAAYPIFGHGLGSYVPEFTRSDRPWQYELQYVLLLFQTGAVGVILYASGIVWLYRVAIRIIRSGSSVGVHLVPVLVGTTCFLIANASNPYLQAFGQLWTIFLPVGLVNWWLVSEAPHLGRSFPRRHSPPGPVASHLV